jgi:hypothetical protein
MQERNNMPTVTNQTIEWFIDTVILGDLKRMIYDSNLHYLAFGTVACSIEFLGACLDNNNFNQQGLSKRRFDNSIAELFVPIDSRYQPINDESSNYYLYKHLRCGMAHIMRPQGNVACTTRSESIVDGTSHLEIETSINKLILVSEDLYDHLAMACADLKNKMRLPGAHKNLTDSYLPITDF